VSILKIAKMGHPILSQKAKLVEDVQHQAIKKLVLDMIETMIDSSGIGLAAPQVYQSVRIIIFKVPLERMGKGEENIELTTLINPVIEILSAEKEEGIEGCLSLPGMIGMVPRNKHIRYSGFSIDGVMIEREAHNYHARVVQHECDHLDGILYPSRMEDLKSFGYVDEIQKSEINLHLKVEEND